MQQQTFYCPNCGATVAYGQPYCSNCNTVLTWQSQQDQGQYQSYQTQYPDQQQWSQQQWDQQQQWNQQQQWYQFPQGNQQVEEKGFKKMKSIGQAIREQIKKNRVIITRVSIACFIVIAIIITSVAFSDEISKWFTPPVISTFDINPGSITVGDQATVQWDVKGATSISISPGIGEVPASGTRIVSPGATTAYSLTASNLGGAVQDEKTLTVTGPLPAIDNFSSNPASIFAGQTATLSWGVTGAKSVSINPGIGEVNTSGTYNVSPGSTTTYTLTATNDEGNATATATVTVTATNAPVVTSFTATPSTIASGNTTILKWDVIGATSISIDQGIGGVASKGSLSVSPLNTTTYTLTADNSYSSVTKGVIVTVDTSGVSPTTTPATTTVPPTITSFTASPSSIILAENSTLEWSVNGARSVKIEPGIGNVPSTGYTLVIPTDTTTYTLSAVNSFGTTTAAATITVTRLTDGTAPVINSFTASPGSISAGGTSSLTWGISGATVIIIDQGIGVPTSYFSQLVSPDSTTTYTLTAINSYGSENRTVTVTVNP